MSKNTACPGVPWVSDPITNQEIAFAHLILSETMNDRRAAKAVGLNPDTAAHTKSKPRVQAYLTEHRATVSERLVDQEADLSRLPRLAEGCAVDGLRKLSPGRDQILDRLWELANLSHEVTRGSIAGQIKALAMIIAIEGLNPSGTMNDRRLSSSAGTKTPPAAPQVSEPANGTSSPQLDRPLPRVADPVINPEPLNRVPNATATSSTPS